MVAVPVWEGLLVTIAQIAATLIGLLVVGVLFYVETGYRRLNALDVEAGALLRATTKLILLLYSLVLGVSLALVAFEPVAVTALYTLLSIAVVTALVEMTTCSRRLPPAVRRRHAAAWRVWPPTFVALGLPWVKGSWPLDAQALVDTLFLIGALALFLTGGLLLFAFDLASAGPVIGDDQYRGQSFRGAPRATPAFRSGTFGEHGSDERPSALRASRRDS